MTSILKEMYSKCLSLENDIKLLGKDISDLDNNLNEPLLENHENEKIFHDCTHDLYDDNHKNDSNVNLNHSSDSDGIGEDEQIIRNVISTKGQFSSLLQSRNLSK